MWSSSYAHQFCCLLKFYSRSAVILCYIDYQFATYTRRSMNGGTVTSFLSLWLKPIVIQSRSAGGGHHVQFSTSVSCITMRKRCLSGATRISLFLARTLKKVMSFIGSRSLTTPLAFLAKSVTAVAIYCGVALESCCDCWNLKTLSFSFTMSSNLTPWWLPILVILSSTSAIALDWS